MFKGYRENARRVIFFARYEACQFGSRTIEPEHLLLGLLREGVENVEFKKEAIWPTLESKMQVGTKIPVADDIPLSESSKAVLKYADEERLSARHAKLHPVHLLLGILRQENSMAAQALNAAGIYLEEVRKVLPRVVETRIEEPELEQDVQVSPHMTDEQYMRKLRVYTVLFGVTSLLSFYIPGILVTQGVWKPAMDFLAFLPATAVVLFWVLFLANFATKKTREKQQT